MQLATGERLLAEQLRDAAVGPVNKAQGSVLSQVGPTFTDAQLCMAVAGDQNWPMVGGEFGFVPGRQQSAVAGCSSEGFRLVARCSSPAFAVYACVTNRSEHDLLSPTFFGPFAEQLERHNQIWATCDADSPQPVYFRLVVDVVNRGNRTVVCRVLERLAPNCPRLRRPAAAESAAEQGRDANGRFQARHDMAA